MIKNFDFFSKIKKHTELKLSIFEETLKASIGIANSMSKQFRSFDYIYIDLYAGKGFYESGDKGSPLRAIDILLNQIKTVNNNFNNIYVLLLEENKDNFLSLKTQIEKIKCKVKKHNIFIEIKYGKWEEYKNIIKEYLNKSVFGFLFLDPFISINFEEFNEIIKTDFIKFKEIMMLFNLHSIKRNLENKEALSTLEKRIKVNLNSITSTNPEVEIIHSIKSFFKKDFRTGISIPIEQKAKVKNIDYFILFLFTNSIGIADNFLEAYNSEISKFNPYKKGGFDPGFNLRNNMIEFLKSKRSTSLYELVTYLHEKVVSWKEATIVSVEIPTLNNIINRLNMMASEKKIKLISSKQKFLGKKNNLLKSKIKRKVDMEIIKIEKIL
jgi:three-Cys-motif partner protein